MKNNLTRLFLAGALLIIYSNAYSKSNNKEKINSDSKFDYSYQDLSAIKDTLYTLKSSFLEVNTAKQMGYLHFKDSIYSFKVSTGTKNVEDGIETHEGLFVIQSKLPKWYSIQFDSTLLVDWMGFNYGIGFHALSTKGYYRYLGKKRSSHGCVRVSKEDAHFIFEHIDIGTPVLIHHGDNVATIALGDSVQYLKYYSYANLLQLLPERYNKIYNGYYFVSKEFKQPKIFIDDDNVTHAGLPIGNAKEIAKRQLVRPFSLFISSTIPSIKNCMIVKKVTIPKIDFSVINVVSLN